MTRLASLLLVLSLLAPTSAMAWTAPEPEVPELPCPPEPTLPIPVASIDQLPCPPEPVPPVPSVGVQTSLSRLA